MRQSPERALAAYLISVMGVLGGPLIAQVDLDESCVVSALNRTARVPADGAWVIPNVPTNLGSVRMRATCVEDGVTRSGQSDFIQIPTNGVIEAPEIVFTDAPGIPARLQIASPTTLLSSEGQDVQLTVSGVLPDGTTVDLSGEGSGTSYTVSSPEVATVSPSGRVVAQRSGVVLVSASNEGALGMIQLTVLTSGDADNDGLPDDWEIANGLDPGDPLDALDDQDGDLAINQEEFQFGLDPRDPDTDSDQMVDGEELQRGTNPLLFDTDGDQVSDGLEDFAGSDPLDPQDVNLAPILDDLAVTPESFTLTFNTIVAEASRRLAVVGTLIDGTELDITGPPYGTSYASSDLTVASFGAEAGRVFAGEDGTATVTASNGSQMGDVEVTVRTVAPSALSFLRIPGFANGVAVQGDYAYVAAGERGLAIVDIVDLGAPFIAGVLNTVGNVNDVRIEGDYAYLASGLSLSGLVIIDVSNLAALELVGSARVVGGEGTDLAVKDGRAYLAAGTAGLFIYDVSNPQDPDLLGSLDTPGNARGVDVSGDLVVVADGPEGVLVIDASDPTSPTLVGSTHTRGATSRAADVAVRETLAYVADGSNVTPGGLRVIDFSEPTTPFVVGSTDNNFGLTGVALERDFAVASDFFFANAVPIFNVASQAPIFTAALDFSGAPSFRDDDGTGIAVQNGVVFLTAARAPGGFLDNGGRGDSGLYIGRYLDPESFENIPPSVTLTSPEDGDAVLERRLVTVAADAMDDIRVAEVEFLVDGVVVHSDFRAPFDYSFAAPQGVSELEIGARALDLAGNEGLAEPIRLVIQPDADPTIELLSPQEGTVVTEGTTLSVAVQATDDVAVTSVELLVDGTSHATRTARPYLFTVSVPLGALELTLTAVATDEIGQSATAAPVIASVRADEAPTVTLITPLEGDEAVASGVLPVVVGAVDDVGVERVRLWVDGTVAGESLEEPHSFEVSVPDGVSTVTLAAEAIDTAGQSVFSYDVEVLVIADPETMVFGRVVDESDQPVSGAEVTAIDRTDQSDLDGFFSIAGVSTIEGDVVASASTELNGVPVAGDSQPTPPIPGGVTDVGDVVVSELPASDLCPCSDPGNWSDPNGVTWSYFLDGTIPPSSCTDTATVTQLGAECVSVNVDASASECEVILPCGGSNLSLPIQATEITACREALRQAAADRGVGCGLELP